MVYIVVCEVFNDVGGCVGVYGVFVYRFDGS